MTIVAPGFRHCRRCAAEHPSGVCRVVPVGGGTLVVCPTCGMVTSEVVRRVARPLPEALLGALRWPLDRNNRVAWLSLGAGVVLFGKIPLFGALLSLTTLWSYLLVVIRRGARGEVGAPAAADFETWWDLAGPLMQGFSAMVFPSLPLVAALYARGATQVILGVFGTAWALLLLPAAVAATAFGGSFARALDPRPMVALVLRVPREYAQAVAVLAALAAGWLGARWLASAVVGLLRVPAPALVLPLAFALEVALIYFPLAMARVVAVLLHERAAELDIELTPGLSAR